MGGLNNGREIEADGQKCVPAAVRDKPTRVEKWLSV